MEFIADLHVHSHYSIATSKECTPDILARYAKIKGVRLLGTGDCTHPGWRAELRERLAPVGGGLYGLKDSASDSGDIRFVVSGEISSIYKKDGRTRKVHSLVLLPSIEDADRLAERLERIGNIRADGRPILGLDARELLAMCLDITAQAIFIPAHIWTPHFSVLGSVSGFDSLQECFDDLTGELAAVETGLSSDPPMNWRLSSLDRYTLVSNSDAHSPRNLAREANRFDCEFSYAGLRNALIRREGCLGTIEFYAEEGKYHLDGHRQCGVSLSPAETVKAGGICPVCGRKLTVGVLHRAERLADRPDGYRSSGAPGFERLVPLVTLIASALGMGEGSRAVQKAYDDTLHIAGSELAALRNTPIEDLSRSLGPLISEAVRRGRTGQLRIAAGFDGQYGRIDVFEPGERDRLSSQAVLFEACHEMAAAKPNCALASSADKTAVSGPCREPQPGLPYDPTPAQRRAIESDDGPVIIVAGPGSGKTSTLVGRLEFLLGVRGVDPRMITAVTFTRKAAGELRERLGRRIGDRSARLHVGTFHQMALEILRQHHGTGTPRIIGDDETRYYLGEAMAGAEPGQIELERRRIGLLKASGSPPDGDTVYSAYQHRLESENAMDYDDILIRALDLIRSNAPAWQGLRARYTHLLVDEFQDINEVQYAFVTEAPGSIKNLFVIGDPDQAIYAFRGADSGLFDRLIREHPEARTFSLNDNFRSAESIVSGAAALISHNSGTHRPMKSVRAGSGTLRHISVSSERHEAREVIKSINGFVGGTDMLSAHGQRGKNGGGGFSFSDIAVLFRTGRQVEVLEEQFVHEGLPYRVVGRESFLEDPAVGELIAWMRCLANPGDHGSLQALFRRYDSTGYRGSLPGIQALDAKRVEPGATDLLLEPFVRERSGWLDSVTGELEYMRRESAHAPIQKVAAGWAARRGEAEAPALKCFLRLASGCESVASLLQQIDAGEDGDFERQGFVWSGVEAVSLMTLHAAKGLEFPVVLVIGVEEGLLPIGDAPEIAAVEEERRLFYVGMTRAVRELILFSCRHRFRQGEMQGRRLSRFVREIPADLITGEVRGNRSDDRQLALFGSSKQKRAAEES